MTQERFFQIVDDPELLRRISYEELKTLALAYPYSHNLRCLLAVKARQVDHSNASRDLATAAAYSLDRTRLFLLVAPQIIVPQQVLAPEEVLELKPIETVKRELEALTPLAREEKKSSQQSIAAESVAPPEVIEKENEVEKTDWAEAVESELVAETIEEKEAPQSFESWFGSFQPPVLDRHPEVKKIVETEAEPEPEETPSAPEQGKTTGIAQQLAERSVAENQDVISETLAKLYAKQGYRDKAAQMYARLALLFPEKSAYFAAEIDKLKK